MFLHQEGDEVVAAGDLWLVRIQESRREAHIAEQRQINERGFLSVMWPHLLVSLVLLCLWIVLLKWYF